MAGDWQHIVGLFQQSMPCICRAQDARGFCPRHQPERYFRTNREAVVQLVRLLVDHFTKQVLERRNAAPGLVQVLEACVNGVLRELQVPAKLTLTEDLVRADRDCDFTISTMRLLGDLVFDSAQPDYHFVGGPLRRHSAYQRPSADPYHPYHPYLTGGLDFATLERSVLAQIVTDAKEAELKLLSGQGLPPHLLYTAPVTILPTACSLCGKSDCEHLGNTAKLSPREFADLFQQQYQQAPPPELARLMCEATAGDGQIGPATAQFWQRNPDKFQQLIHLIGGEPKLLLQCGVPTDLIAARIDDKTLSELPLWQTDANAQRRADAYLDEKARLAQQGGFLGRSRLGQGFVFNPYIPTFLEGGRSEPVDTTCSHEEADLIEIVHDEFALYHCRVCDREFEVKAA